MLTLEQALERVLALIPPAVPEPVALEHACGRIVLETLHATIDLPSFDNSAMDGYAVRADETAAASPERPVILSLAGQVSAGTVFTGMVSHGQAVRIFTGSPMPEGADAVVMQEDTTVRPAVPAEVQINSPVVKGENVRVRGEDISTGTALTEAGQMLTPTRLALVAAQGFPVLSVGRRPSIAILATGSELRNPGEPLAPGQIYESTRAALASLAQAAGALADMHPVVEDSLAATSKGLERAFSTCDAVVSCGGASVGDLDFVKRAFSQAGGDIDFWRVAMKPGRPFVFGRLKGKLLFGLPGNPVSALVTFLLLVRPALLRWQGAQNLGPPGRPALLAATLSNPGERRHFMRVRFDASGRVVSAGLQASHALGTLAASDGLVDVPPGAVLSPGTPVQVITWQ